MKTKTILTMAIIAALPFTAIANNRIGPAPFDWDSDDDPVVATSEAYYAIEVPTVADQSHIATTAYVKGAYNDLIAGMNRMGEDKQSQLFYRDANDENVGVFSEVYKTIGDVTNHSELVSGLAVKNAIDSVDNKIDNKRVEIYTTWDNDNAKTQVAFVNAPAQQ